MNLSSLTAHMRIDKPFDISKYNHVSVTGRRGFNSAVYKGNGFSALLYPNGSAVILGCKNCDLLESIANELAALVDAKVIAPPMVTNQVYSGMITRPIVYARIPAVLRDAGFTVSYEPELFPVVLITSNSYKGKMQLFASGKYVITGVVSESEASTLCERVVQALYVFAERE